MLIFEDETAREVVKRDTSRVEEYRKRREAKTIDDTRAGLLDYSKDDGRFPGSRLIGHRELLLCHLAPAGLLRDVIR